jgi:flagellar biogenesis protein FliO
MYGEKQKLDFPDDADTIALLLDILFFGSLFIIVLFLLVVVWVIK